MNATPIPFAQKVSCTIREACDATGLGRTTIYEHINRGRLKSKMVGRRRLVLVRSLLDLVEPTTTATAA